MSFSIVPTEDCLRSMKKLGKKYSSFKADILAISDSLRENPKQGTLITDDCYKVRFSISSKPTGKRDSGRLVSYIYVASNTIYLLAVYDKSEYTTVNMDVIKGVIQEILKAEKAKEDEDKKE